MSGKPGSKATINLTPHETMYGPVGAFIHEFATARHLGSKVSLLVQGAGESFLEVILASQPWTSLSHPVAFSLAESPDNLDLTVTHSSSPLQAADMNRLDVLLAKHGITTADVSPVQVTRTSTGGQSLLLRFRLP